MLVQLNRHVRVVPYQYSTSNRNHTSCIQLQRQLFLISILHQTATDYYIPISRRSCSLSVFYIKPQPYDRLSAWYGGCSLSVFYIKPQPMTCAACGSTVVPYQYSTSNRNIIYATCVVSRLFLISILHQTATERQVDVGTRELFLISILHQTATIKNIHDERIKLFLISILHQTATIQEL